MVIYYPSFISTETLENTFVKMKPNQIDRILCLSDEAEKDKGPQDTNMVASAAPQAAEGWTYLKTFSATTTGTPKS